jgi:NAD(P)-dependent dehydrogenase (short-subunit alcohol dehydrogenase family)
MNMFKDKVAIVTGGNSGIGYATAKELIAQGAVVIITGRRKEAIEKAAAELGAIAIVADQGKLADIDRLTAEVSGRFGKVDILFINAGIGTFAPVENTTEEQFDSVMNVNFKGAYFTLSKFVPFLQDGASVIMLSSNSATMSIVNSSVYAASKSALNTLTRIAAAELAPRRIRVNAISPGPTQTEIMSKFGIDEVTLTEIKASLVTQIPLRKMGSAEDVAKWVVYLSGEAASFITGSEFVMDGGMML